MYKLYLYRSHSAPNGRKLPEKAGHMFNPAQYRVRAGEYGDLANSSASLQHRRSFRELEQKFAVLADNEQWLADNYKDAVHSEQNQVAGTALANEEEFVLRCLGAALILQWNSLPTELRRELFDNAGAMGELSNTSALRAQIARLLHKHKNAARGTVASAAS
jgi:hypothetical protein